MNFGPMQEMYDRFDMITDSCIEFDRKIGASTADTTVALLAGVMLTFGEVPQNMRHAHEWAVMFVSQLPKLGWTHRNEAKEGAGDQECRQPENP